MLKLLGSDIALHPEKGWQLLLYLSPIALCGMRVGSGAWGISRHSTLSVLSRVSARKHCERTPVGSIATRIRLTISKPTNHVGQ
jgi:hypothetical protein